jgi:hypothetical protein|tara:strand:+ start:3883 stop:4200 length:318 start_codon:yes stop_codon:yes gene_type:complete
MAITKTWEINTLERDLSDGYVTKVIYRVKGLSDSEEKARATGEVTFTKPSSLPSDFIAYDSLTSSKVLGWVTTALGSDEVKAIETALEAEVTEAVTPTSATGVPW